MSPTPSQLLRPTALELASRGVADNRRREGQVVKTMPWRNWLSHLTTARFGLYHSLGSDS
jgi:hypothetical protein